MIAMMLSILAKLVTRLPFQGHLEPCSLPVKPGARFGYDLPLSHLADALKAERLAFSKVITSMVTNSIITSSQHNASFMHHKQTIQL